MKKMETQFSILTSKFSILRKEHYVSQQREHSGV